MAWRISALPALTTHRGILGLPADSLAEARQTISRLSAEGEKSLQDRFGSEYSVVREQLLDPQQSFQRTMSESAPGATLNQGFLVTRGWKQGARVRIQWPDIDGKSFYATCESCSKLEDSVAGLCVTSCGILGAVWMMASGRGIFLRMMLGGCAGAVLGWILYMLTGAPLVHFATRKFDEENDRLARDLLHAVESRPPSF